MILTAAPMKRDQRRVVDAENGILEPPTLVATGAAYTGEEGRSASGARPEGPTSRTRSGGTIGP